MPTLFRQDQIQHLPRLMELQHVPLRAALVDLRMPHLQAQVLRRVQEEGRCWHWLRASKIGEGPLSGLVQGVFGRMLTLSRTAEWRTLA